MVLFSGMFVNNESAPKVVMSSLLSCLHSCSKK